jgi:predicted ATPase
VLAAAAAEDAETRARELGHTLTEWESTGNRLYLSFFHALHAEAELDAGNIAGAATILERAQAVARETGERFYEPEIHRLLGTVALQLGDKQLAASHVERGLDIARDLGLLALRHRLETTIDAPRH